MGVQVAAQLDQLVLVLVRDDRVDEGGSGVQGVSAGIGTEVSLHPASSRCPPVGRPAGSAGKRSSLPTGFWARTREVTYTFPPTRSTAAGCAHRAVVTHRTGARVDARDLFPNSCETR